MLKKVLRIATRGSELAVWQAEHVKQRLQNLYPDLEVELVVLKTRGDKILDVPLAKVGGKGLFVKELETAMLEERADIAVHSMKDVPMELPQGLGLAVICERESPLDAFVSNGAQSLDELPQGAVVGTSSLRRKGHLLALRPDLEIRFLRGNVNTRLAKLDEGHYEAIILAAAGLKRLGLDARITQLLDAEQSLPAVGQGAIGIECRANDIDTIALLRPLHHRDTALCVSTERVMNKTLNGGCQVPIAGYARLEGDDRLWLRGIVADPESGKVLFAQRRGPIEQHEQIGLMVAQELVAQGAGEILEAVYGAG